MFTELKVITSIDKGFTHTKLLTLWGKMSLICQETKTIHPWAKIYWIHLHKSIWFVDKFKQGFQQEF